MDNRTKYKFKYRPEYGSENLLLEFISGVENETFRTDLFDAIKEIKPNLVKCQDIWVNDEILYTINSDFGQFELSKNSWDFAFIFSNKNQSCLLQIYNLLLCDNRFEKIEVDFKDYQSKQNASS